MILLHWVSIKGLSDRNSTRLMLPVERASMQAKGSGLVTLYQEVQCMLVPGSTGKGVSRGDQRPTRKQVLERCRWQYMACETSNNWKDSRKTKERL